MRRFTSLFGRRGVLAALAAGLIDNANVCRVFSKSCDVS